ncbi:uclacyanin-3-like [Magnolia sinica]|uniref:uclacyanin-3-like n=1 Tax=Magnolia sinica TaxID=86752 RepID=UPI002659C490|nr:uclacyanin-3-like [Magnolia sinica]
MARAVVFLALLLIVPAAYATQYTVGDTNGWTTGVNYVSWASGKNFAVGDTLLFTYGSNHGVDEVSQVDYNNCNSNNAISSASGGSTPITLTNTGSRYFLCPTFGHCGQGMRLAVTVGGANTTTPTTPSTPTTTPSGTPSPPSTSTPSNTNHTSPSGGSTVRVNALVVGGASLVLAPLFG